MVEQAQTDVPELAISKRDEQTAIGNVQSQRETALLQAQFVIAIQKPRDEMDATQRLRDVCRNRIFANKAYFDIPRGGKSITGFTIRFAEEALRLWGNISCSSTITNMDDESIVVHISVIDVERNVSVGRDTIISRVIERRKVQEGRKLIGTRKNSRGQTLFLYSATPDELAERIAAVESKVKRSEGLRLIPAHIKEELWEIIGDTVTSDVSLRDKKEKYVAKWLDNLSSVGIPVSEVREYFGGTPLSGMTKEQWQKLLGIYNAIQSGNTTWREVMQEKAEAEASIGVKKDEGQVKHVAAEVVEDAF